MANPGGQSEIGSVSVGVTADTTNLTAGLEDAKRQTEKATGAMDNAWVRFGGTLRKFRTSVFGAVSALSGMATAIGLVVGAVYTLIAVVVRANTRVDEIRKTTERMKQAVHEAFAAPPTSALQKTLDELDEKLKQIDKDARALPNNQRREVIDKALDEHKAARERAINDELGAQRIDNIEQEEKRRIEALQKENEKQERDSRTRQAIDEDQFNERQQLEEWNRQEEDRISRERLDREQQITEEKRTQAEIAQRMRDEAQRQGNIDTMPSDISRIRHLSEIGMRQRFPAMPGSGEA